MFSEKNFKTPFYKVWQLQNHIRLIFFVVLFSIATSSVFSQGIFNTQEANGCPKKDPFLPTLVICGRSPATGACPAYTNPCTVGDLVETGRRGLIWIISIVLLVLPVMLAYLGVQMIFQQKLGGNIEVLAKLKKNMLMIIIYFVCLLGAWLIVRSIVDIAQVNPRINTFLIDQNGRRIEARQFDFSR